KPDLVAPGNKIVSAAATTSNSGSPTWNYMASTYYSNLVAPLGITAIYPETQMQMSGTSIAAPVVTGAVALMLQANPGLTPPLIKAILQYTAQPLPNYNLLQQGAGTLNIDGAIVLANALKTDIATQIQANGLHGGRQPNAGHLGRGGGKFARRQQLPDEQDRYLHPVHDAVQRADQRQWSAVERRHRAQRGPAALRRSGAVRRSGALRRFGAVRR